MTESILDQNQTAKLEKKSLLAEPPYSNVFKKHAFNTDGAVLRLTWPDKSR